MSAVGEIAFVVLLVIGVVAYVRYASAQRLRRAGLDSGTTPPAQQVFRCGGTIGGRLYTGIMITVRLTEHTVSIGYPLGSLEIPKANITAVEVQRRAFGASLTIRFRNVAAEPPSRENIPAQPGNRETDEQTIELDSAYAERMRDAILGMRHRPR